MNVFFCLFIFFDDHCCVLGTLINIFPPTIVLKTHYDEDKRYATV